MDNNKKQETEESKKRMKSFLKKWSVFIVPVVLLVAGRLIDNMIESKDFSFALTFAVIGLLTIACYIASLTSKLLAGIILVVVIIVGCIKFNDYFPDFFGKTKDLIKQETVSSKSHQDKEERSVSKNKILDDITNVGSFSDNARLSLYADKPFKIIYSLNGGDFGYATVYHPAGYSTQDFGNGGDLIIEGKDRNDVIIVKETRIKKKK